MSILVVSSRVESSVAEFDIQIKFFSWKNKQKRRFTSPVDDGVAEMATTTAPQSHKPLCVSRRPARSKRKRESVLLEMAHSRGSHIARSRQRATGYVNTLLRLANTLVEHQNLAGKWRRSPTTLGAGAPETSLTKNMSNKS